MEYKTKVKYAGTILGIGLCLFGAYAITVDITLWPFVIILEGIGAYIALSPVKSRNNQEKRSTK